jgi:hypothetical protein
MSPHSHAAIAGGQVRWASSGTCRSARPDRPNRPIQVRLPAGREDAIRRLFRTVLDREAAFHGSAGATVRTLDAAAAEVLGSPPTLGSPLPGRSQNR